MSNERVRSISKLELESSKSRFQPVPTDQLPRLSEKSYRHVKYKLPPIEKVVLPPIEKKQIEVRVPIIVKKPRTLVVKRECNYIPAMDSLPSILSNIPEHWKDGQARVARDRPSESEFQQQVHKTEDRSDSIEEEAEGVLPRTFFPLGVDWDSRLEAMNYGTDVTLKSSSSTMSMDDQNDMDSPTDFMSVADWFMHAKGVRAAQEAPLSVIVSDDDFEEDDKKSKKVIVDRAPPRLIFGEHSTSRDDTLLKLQAARRRQRKETKERTSLDKHFKKLNEAMLSDGPMDHTGFWTTDEPVAHHIMRRATVETFQGREVIHNLIRRSCLKRRTLFNEYLDQLKYIKKELDSIDSVRQVALTNELLNGFCYHNSGETVDLILHGKHVFQGFGRRLYDFDLPYIFLFVLDRPNIIRLDFCYNHLTCLGVRFLADFFSWNQTIISLNLMNNDIEAIDSYVVDAFGENHTLKSLRLNGNPFGKKGGEYVSFLLMFKDLEHLDIGQTDQTIQSLAWISEALIQTSSLKILDLSRILGHPGYVNDSLHYGLAFSDILRLNRSLVELHVPKNNITDVDLEQILFGLSFNRTLELLDLSSNSIGDIGAELMADSLHRGAPLKALMLSGNHIGNIGARAFSFKLPMSQIKFLDLSNNRIKDDGIIDIVATVKKPYPLLALFIFGNPFGRKTLQMLEFSLLNGRVDAKSLDIDLHYHNGIVGHGRNRSANRYQTRYYRWMEPRRPEIQNKNRKNEILDSCETGCAAYEFHNVFNVPKPRDQLPWMYSSKKDCPI